VRLGLGSFALAWSLGVPGSEPSEPLTLEGLLEFAQSLGYEGVQIGDNTDLALRERQTRQSVFASARERGLFVEVGGRGLTEANLARHLDFAAEAGSPILRMVVDAAGFEPGRDEIEGRLREAASECQRREIRLAIENHDRFEARQYAAWLDRVGSEWLGVCLDSVNSFGCGEGLKETLDTLIPYTINFHLKDFRVRRADHNMGFSVEGTPAGEGFLPVAECVERLEALGRCQSAIVELWPAPEATVEETVRKERAWCERSRRNLEAAFPKEPRGERG